MPKTASVSLNKLELAHLRPAGKLDQPVKDGASDLSTNYWGAKIANELDGRNRFEKHFLLKPVAIKSSGKAKPQSTLSTDSWDLKADVDEADRRTGLQKPTPAMREGRGELTIEMLCIGVHIADVDFEAYSETGTGRRD